VTTIISGIFGAYDKPKIPIPQSIPVRYVMVTDNPELRAPGWDVQVAKPLTLHPRSSAKFPKFFPWLHSDDGPWIWIDGSMSIESRTFAAEAIDATTTFGMWRHPDRDCVFDEASFSAILPKYTNEPLRAQARHYRNLGHPTGWGLWATGLIVYKQALTRLAAAWWNEIIAWGYQDQVSLPFVLRRLPLWPEPLPHDLRANPWIRIVPHKDGTS
jgi:Protein of unknown function (DUF616)